jgi:hypothetical protein
LPNGLAVNVAQLSYALLVVEGFQFQAAVLSGGFALRSFVNPALAQTLGQKIAV